MWLLLWPLQLHRQSVFIIASILIWYSLSSSSISFWRKRSGRKENNKRIQSRRKWRWHKKSLEKHAYHQGLFDCCLRPPVSNSIENSKQWSGRFLGIIGWDPRVCKSYQLHVDILWFSLLIKWGFILQITLKRLVIFLQFWISTGYFSNSTGSSITNCWFSPIIDSKIIMSFSFLFLFEIEGRHASVKAQVVVDHLVRFPSSS